MRCAARTCLLQCLVVLGLYQGPTVVAGQTLVKDIWPGIEDSGIRHFVAIDDIIYFAASDSVNGHELWRSDGTYAGTFLVKDVYPGTNSSDVQHLTEVGGTLYFTARSRFLPFGRELWRIDGTADGTTLVLEVEPELLFSVGGKLYFVLKQDPYGTELWKTDGTASGTAIVKDIAPGSAFAEPDFLVEVNDIIFFVADDAVHGRELWRTDGTESGTVLVKDINPTGGSWPYQLTSFDNSLFFVAREASRHQLWKSDGTNEGTVLIKDELLLPTHPVGGTNVVESSVPGLTDVDGTLFFVAQDSVSGAELWKSDGTPEGTHLVKDVHPGRDDSHPSSLAAVNNRLYFTAIDGTHGRELWSSDGTPEGTVLVKDINPGVGSSRAGAFVDVDGTVFFSASAGTGNKLWKSDGSEIGTVVAADLEVGCQFCSPWPAFIDIGRNLYFAGRDSSHGRELWTIEATSSNAETAPIRKATYSLSEPYPNPFRDTTTLTLSTSTSQDVTVSLYDVLGRRVRTLYRQRVHESIPIEFAVDGSGLSGGIYFVLVQGADFRDSQAVTVFR